MRTKLPKSIKTIVEAKKFLTDLVSNNEEYHPEDDATKVIFEASEASIDERKQLNKLMSDIYNFKGNESHLNMVFDPCCYLIELTNPFGIDDLNN